MINSSNINGGMSSPSSSANPRSLGLKTYFKTPEGRYKLHNEKTHPSTLLQYPHGKSVTQVTLAHLKEKQAQLTPTQGSSISAPSGVRYAAARFLGGGNGGRTLSFAGGNGTSKSLAGTSRSSSLGGLSNSNSMLTSNYDGKGTYLIFNVGDTIYISDFNSQDKDPIKAIHFSNSNPVCHAFDAEAKDGHDLLIGLNSGDVYSVSLRQQLQDVGKKLVGAHHYNKDGSAITSRCTSIAWIPQDDGAFVVGHADGNLYVYEKGKDGTGDSSFPVIKDQTQFTVAHARSSKVSYVHLTPKVQPLPSSTGFSVRHAPLWRGITEYLILHFRHVSKNARMSNPVARWHICLGSINSIAFSSDGTYLATVGRDGYLRVFDYSKEQLICGGKSYYGALLCCSWSMDGKYILTGGEDDLVQVWSMEDRKVVAWGEGHGSWVSAVAFDSYWSSPSSDSTGESVMYRFGSVGQDTQLLLWDLSMEEIVVPLRRCPPGGSPTFNSGNQSSQWDSISPVGNLLPAPSMQDVPKLSPVVAHRIHPEPLSGLIFTQESILTACREGHVKVWTRPRSSESPPSNSESLLTTSSKEKLLSPGKDWRI